MFAYSGKSSDPDVTQLPSSHFRERHSRHETWWRSFFFPMALSPKYEIEVIEHWSTMLINGASDLSEVSGRKEQVSSAYIAQSDPMEDGGAEFLPTNDQNNPGRSNHNRTWLTRAAC